MKNDIEFYERQRMHQWWYWGLLICLNVFMIWRCVSTIWFGLSFGNQPADNTVLILITVLILTVSLILLFISMVTCINKDGIFVRFHPVQIKHTYIAWDEIEQVYIRKYKPILEYGDTDLDSDLTIGHIVFPEI